MMSLNFASLLVKEKITNHDNVTSMLVWGSKAYWTSLKPKKPTIDEQSKKKKYKELNSRLYYYLVLYLDDTNVRSIEIDCYEDGWKAWHKIMNK